MSKSGHSIALWRLENQVSPPCLHNVEFNFSLCMVGWESWFLSLHTAMECPNLGIIDELLKNLFSSSHTHFVSETTSKLSLLKKKCNQDGEKWTIECYECILKTALGVLGFCVTQSSSNSWYRMIFSIGVHQLDSLSRPNAWRRVSLTCYGHTRWLYIVQGNY